MTALVTELVTEQGIAPVTELVTGTGTGMTETAVVPTTVIAEEPGVTGIGVVATAARAGTVVWEWPGVTTPFSVATRLTATQGFRPPA